MDIFISMLVVAGVMALLLHFTSRSATETRLTHECERLRVELERTNRWLDIARSELIKERHEQARLTELTGKLLIQADDSAATMASMAEELTRIADYEGFNDDAIHMSSAARTVLGREGYEESE